MLSTSDEFKGLGMAQQSLKLYETKVAIGMMPGESDLGGGGRMLQAGMENVGPMVAGAVGARIGGPGLGAAAAGAAGQVAEFTRQPLTGEPMRPIAEQAVNRLVDVGGELAFPAVSAGMRATRNMTQSAVNRWLRGLGPVEAIATAGQTIAQKGARIGERWRQAGKATTEEAKSAQRVIGEEGMMMYQKHHPGDPMGMRGLMHELAYGAQFAPGMVDRVANRQMSASQAYIESLGASFTREADGPAAVAAIRGMIIDRTGMARGIETGLFGQVDNLSGGYRPDITDVVARQKEQFGDISRIRAILEPIMPEAYRGTKAAGRADAPFKLSQKQTRAQLQREQAQLTELKRKKKAGAKVVSEDPFAADIRNLEDQIEAIKMQSAKKPIGPKVEARQTGSRLQAEQAKLDDLLGQRKLTTPWGASELDKKIAAQRQVVQQARGPAGQARSAVTGDVSDIESASQLKSLQADLSAIKRQQRIAQKQAKGVTSPIDEAIAAQEQKVLDLQAFSQTEGAAVTEAQVGMLREGIEEATGPMTLSVNGTLERISKLRQLAREAKGDDAETVKRVANAMADQLDATLEGLPAEARMALQAARDFTKMNRTTLSNKAVTSFLYNLSQTQPDNFLNMMLGPQKSDDIVKLKAALSEPIKAPDGTVISGMQGQTLWDFKILPAIKETMLQKASIGMGRDVYELSGEKLKTNLRSMSKQQVNALLGHDAYEGLTAVADALTVAQKRPGGRGLLGSVQRYAAIGTAVGAAGTLASEEGSVEEAGKRVLGFSLLGMVLPTVYAKYMIDPVFAKSIAKGIRNSGTKAGAQLLVGTFERIAGRVATEGLVASRIRETLDELQGMPRTAY
jgi:hypothetical protein